LRAHGHQAHAKLEDAPHVAAKITYYFAEIIFRIHIIYVNNNIIIIIFSSRCMIIPIQPPENACTADKSIECLRCANMIY
jgi:hypothetical protein